MDLEVLNLQANTESLDKAVTSIDKLDSTIGRLEKTLAQLERSFSQSMKSVAQAQKQIETASKGAASGLSYVQKQIDKTNTTLQGMSGQLIGVGGKWIKVSDALTKGQYSILATAKNTGAAAKEVKQLSSTLELLNKVTGKNPFDAAMNPLAYYKNRVSELQKTVLLSEQYNDLSQEQLRLIARQADLVRLRANAEGMNIGQREAAVKKETAALVEQMRAENKIKDGIAERNRLAQEQVRLQQEAARAAQVSAKQRADAEKYVQETLQRTLFMNEQMDKGMSTSGANALYAYKQQLDLLGLSADQAAAKMQEFQSALTTKQGLQGRANPIRQMREDIHNTTQEVNQLARAVSVQLGDVFVSLAGGMNPLLVAIQQGDQIRFALEQAKAAGQGLDNVMRGAFASMANSFVLVGSIVKDFLIDGIMSAGKLVTNFNTSVLDAIGRMVGLGNAATNTIKAFEDGAAAGNKFSVAMVGVMNVSRILAGGLLLGIVAAIGTFAVASVKLSNDLDKLAVALNMSGASLGLTAQQAQAAAEKISDSYGTSIYDALDAVTLFATKNIQFTDEMIVSATELSRVTGKSLSDIIDSYSSLKGKPVEGLLDVAIATGQVNIETIKAIDKLVEQGDVAKATKDAMQEKARAEQEAARNTLAEMTPLGRLYDTMKKDVKALGDAVYALVTQSPLVDVFRTAWETVAVLTSEVWYVIKAIGTEIGGIFAQISSVISTRGLAGSAAIREAMVSDAESARKAQDALVETILNRGADAAEAAKKEAEAAAKRREESGKAASEYKKEYEARKKGADEAGKEAEKTQKYFEKLMEGASDLALKTQQEVSKLNSGYEQMTNSQKMLFDAQNDRDKNGMLLWDKLSERQKNEFKATLELIAVNEELIRQYNAQVALQEILSKWADDYESAALSIKEEVAALELRNNLLFKTEEEAKAIQRQYDLNVKLAAVENKYIERRNRMMMDYVKLVQDGNWSPEALEEYQRNMASAVQQEAIERELAHKDANLKIVEDYEKRFREVQETITDIVATALFEGGKAGSIKLKDVLKSEFRKFVIDVIINPVVGNTMGSLFGTSGRSSGGGNSLNGTASDLSSMYSAATGSWLTGASSAIQSLGSAFGSSAVSSFGAGLGMTGTQVAALSEAGLITNTGAASMGSSIGAAAGPLAFAAIAGGFAGDLLFDGKGYSGAGGSIGATAGMIVGGPIGAAIGSVLGSALGSIIGGKPSDKSSWATVDPTTGVVSGVGSMTGKKDPGQGQRDATAQLAAALGEFASLAGVTKQITAMIGQRDGIRVTIAGSEQKNYGYQDTETIVKSVFNDIMKQSKLPKEVVDSWKSLNSLVKTSGDSFANLYALVAGFNEETIRFAYSIKDSSVSLMDTLFKLTSQLNSVNAVFQVLGYNLIDINTAGYKAADSLVRLFGSIEAMNSATSIYYENFYTEEEKITLQTKQLTDAFKLLGFSLPKTREEYRKLVEMQDLNSEYGRIMYVSLINLSGAFNQIIPAIDTLEGRLGTLIGTLVGDTLSEIDKQIQSSSDAAIKARESSKAYADAGASIRKAIENILLLNVSSLQSSRFTYQSTIASARTGDLNSMKVLPQIAEALNREEREMAATAADAARASAKITKELSQIEQLAKDTEGAYNYQAKLFDVNTVLLETVKQILTSEDLNLKLLQESIDAVNRIGNIIKESSIEQIIQINKVEGASLENASIADIVAAATQDNASLSALIISQLESPDAGSEYIATVLALGNEFVASKLDGVIDAINKQTMEQQAEIKKQQDVAKAQKELEARANYYKTLEDARIAAEQRLASTPQTIKREGILSFLGIFNSLLRPKENPEYANAYNSLLQAQSAAASYAEELENQRQVIRNLGAVPAFATGGVFTDGVISRPTTFNMGLMGEAGPEAIMPLTNVGGSLGVRAQMQDNSELIEELQALRGEVVMLRAEVRADVTHNAKTAKLLDRVIPDGQSISVREAV